MRVRSIATPIRSAASATHLVGAETLKTVVPPPSPGFITVESGPDFAFILDHNPSPSTPNTNWPFCRSHPTWPPPTPPQPEPDPFNPPPCRKPTPACPPRWHPVQSNGETSADATGPLVTIA